MPLGYLIGIAAVWSAKPTPLTLTAGFALAAAGELLRLWASGHLIKGGSSLTSSGPYGWTRNPLYLGSLLVGLGFSLATARWQIAAACLTFFTAVYVPVMRVEARRMREVHRDAYAVLEAEVPLFFPRLTPSPSRDRRRFSLDRVRVNREHWTLLGCLSIALILWLRV